MIKNVVIGLLLFSVSVANAQENKNKFVVSGHLAYATNKFTDKYAANSSNKSINNESWASITIGYFLTNNFALGIAGNFYKTGYDGSSFYQGYESHYQTEQSRYMPALFARYNQPLRNNKFAFTYTFNGGFYTGKTSTISEESSPGMGEKREITGKVSGINVNFSPGLLYFISKNFSVETTLGSVYYNSQKIKYNDALATSPPSNKSSGFGLDFSLTSINVGFSVYFGGRSQTSDSK
jgi:outer membrane immunogenic protein